MECPSCHKTVEVLEKNFGALFTCPECQAVYFVNFDGLPEYSDSEESNSSPENPEFPVATENFNSLEIPDPLINNFENPFLESAAVQDVSQSEFSHVAKEIADFGNSDTQISSMNYDLEITGLDSKEELSAFKDAISESRFGWEPADILKQIRHGELKLEKLNPVQAFVLARRIRYLNLDVKWRQNVLE